MWLHITKTLTTCSGHTKPFYWHVYSWLGPRRRTITHKRWPYHGLTIMLGNGHVTLCHGHGRHPTLSQRYCGLVDWVSTTSCDKDPCIHYPVHSVCFICISRTIAIKIVVKDDPSMTWPLCSIMDVCLFVTDFLSALPPTSPLLQLNRSAIYYMMW